VANIGSLSVLVSSNAEQFSAGMAKAAQSLDAFGASAAKVQKDAGDVFDGLTAKATGLLTSLPFLGTAFAAITGGGFFAWITSGQEKLQELGKTARRLGTDVNTLSALQIAAGLSAEDMTTGLFHLQRELGAASAGSTEAQAKFEKLGLDWQALSVMGFAEKLGVISDRSKDLALNTEKAHLAFEVFGRSGSDYGKLLAGGAQGIAAAGAKAQGLGLGVSQEELTSVMNVGLAYKDISRALDGIQRQAAVAFAPLIGSAAEWVSGLLKDKEGLKDFWKSFADSVEGAAVVALNYIDQIIDSIGDLGKMFKTQLTELAGWGDTIKNLFSLKPPKGGVFSHLLGFEKDVPTTGVILEGDKKTGSNISGDVAKMLHDWRENAAKKLGQSGTATLADSGTKFDDKEAAKKLTASIGELDKALGSQIAGFGKGADAAKIWRFEQDGATDAMLKSTRALAAQADALKVMDEMKKHAADLAKDLQTPLETFEGKLEDLQNMLQAGLIDTELYARGAAKAFDALQGKDLTISARSPAGLAQGSAAAISAVTRATNQGRDGGRDDQQKRIENVLRDQLGVERMTSAYARETADALKNLKIVDF
jgi:hypothetical protein